MDGPVIPFKLRIWRVCRLANASSRMQAIPRSPFWKTRTRGTAGIPLCKESGGGTHRPQGIQKTWKKHKPSRVTGRKHPWQANWRQNRRSLGDEAFSWQREASFLGDQIGQYKGGGNFPLSSQCRAMSSSRQISVTMERRSATMADNSREVSRREICARHRMGWKSIRSFL